MEFGKFNDITYKRVEITDYKKSMEELMKEFGAAGSGEEQFKVHEKYYELNDHMMTEYTLSMSMITVLK